MAAAKGPGDDFTKELLANYSNLLNSEEPSRKTIFEAVIQKIDRAVKNGDITQDLAQKLLPESLLRLKDREIRQLSSEDQQFILNVFKTQLGSPNQVDDGYASGSSETPSISKQRLGELAKEFQTTLKELCSESFGGSVRVEKSIIPFTPYKLFIPLDLEILTPLPKDLSLEKDVPDLFRVDQLDSQRSKHINITFKEPGFPLKPTNVQSQEEAKTLIQLADQFSKTLQRNYPEHAKAIKHALLFFLTQHIQNASIGPLIGSIAMGFASKGVDSLGISPNPERLELTILPTPPDGFQINMKGKVPYVSQHAKDTPVATLSVEGSLTCRVSPTGECEIQEPQFAFKLTIP